jgi:hypothetical protein
MGANAQTKVPTFAAAEVLTAANQNLLSNGIPVFSGTATRDDAFGGSGEKTLAEGQFAFLEDTNTTQYYDGAAWQSVGTAAGLVFITGATFSAAATVSFATDTFTSTYDNYRVIFNIASSSASNNIRFRMRAAGADNSTANYAVGGFSVLYGGSTAVSSTSGDTAGYLLGTVTTVGNQMAMDVISPKATANTEVLGIQVGASGTNGAAGFFGNAFLATTSFDSMTIYPTSGTITGSYKVYGYSNS